MNDEVHRLVRCIRGTEKHLKMMRESNLDCAFIDQIVSLMAQMNSELKSRIEKLNDENMASFFKDEWSIQDFLNIPS